MKKDAMHLDLDEESRFLLDGNNVNVHRVSFK